MQKRYCLTWVDEGDLVRSEVLRQGSVLRIGRAYAADIVIADPSVSRIHAQLAWRDDVVTIQDLGSRYGSWVKGKRLRDDEQAGLYENCEIRLGNLSIWFEIHDEDHEIDSIRTCFLTEPHPSRNRLTPELTAFKHNILHEFQSFGPDPGLQRNLAELIDRELAVLNETHQEQLKEQRILNSISHILNRSVTLAEISRNALDLISKVLSADRGFIMLPDPDHAGFHLVAHRNFHALDGSQPADAAKNYSDTLVRRCFERGEIMLFDVANDPEIFSRVTSLGASDASSILLIPLHDKKGVNGVIYLDSSRRLPCFEDRHIPFLETFAVHTSIALQNARLYKWAITDDLTQLYNRKYIDERLQQEIDRARRYQRPFCILLLDLDHFKQINDTYGHSTGDRVLQNVSSILKTRLRDTDIAGRFGGEEFIVILGETARDGAWQFAERLRQEIEQSAMEKAGETIRITVSIGVACCRTLDEDRHSALIENADAALYQAKDGGRNQVVVAD